MALVPNVPSSAVVWPPSALVVVVRVVLAVATARVLAAWTCAVRRAAAALVVRRLRLDMYSVVLAVAVEVVEVSTALLLAALACDV